MVLELNWMVGHHAGVQESFGGMESPPPQHTRVVISGQNHFTDTQLHCVLLNHLKVSARYYDLLSLNTQDLSPKDNILLYNLKTIIISLNLLI